MIRPKLPLLREKLAYPADGKGMALSILYKISLLFKSKTGHFINIFQMICKICIFGKYLILLQVRKYEKIIEIMNISNHFGGITGIQNFLKTRKGCKQAYMTIFQIPLPNFILFLYYINICA